MVYVLDKEGKPLMPTNRHGKVRRLLRDKLAHVARREPFTIQLDYEPKTHIVQDLYLGIDPGRTNIGVSVVRETGVEVFAAEIETRNKEIPKLMQARKAFRNKHRQKKRRRQRQNNAKKCQTTLAKGSIERKLPQCEEKITCKFIRNKESRFCNRTRKKGWLTPTANHLKQTHLNLINKIAKFLPISNIVVELNKFAFMRLEDSTVSGLDFQNGILKGFKSVEDAIYKVQQGKCLFCDSPIEHYHHIKPKSKGGNESLLNRCGVCAKHHKAIHTGKLDLNSEGQFKKYGALSILNQIMPSLLEELEKNYKVAITFGYETKRVREENKTLKSHSIDAYFIACSNTNVTASLPSETVYRLKQYRRHDRQAVHKEMVNRVYYLGKQKVAVNRRRALEQKEISLEEYARNNRVDNLTVKEHKLIYKRQDRILPGATYLAGGRFRILKGTDSLYKGKPVYYNFENRLDDIEEKNKFSYKEVELVKQNTGLVFIALNNRSVSKTVG